MAELADRLGLPFANLSLLQQALVHSSYLHEQPAAGESNERLEFLGDSVISLIISERLWREHPGEDEGSLSTRRAAIVSARALAAIAERLELGRYVQLGHGARAAGEEKRASVLAAALEAVVGAVYLEFGLEGARDWLLSVAEEELAGDRALASLKPAKSRLQELGYARSGRPPHYRLVSDEGPPHSRHFVVEVLIDDVVLGRGEGRNRREAETEAAVHALAAFGDGKP
ncbi:MAG TPA: ribonuclease III [Candidatus Limnocylindria bacterium]|nr:ribonuclease III [Candidatus Limnocylindria bacterium]